MRDARRARVAAAAYVRRTCARRAPVARRLHPAAMPAFLALALLAVVPPPPATPTLRAIREAEHARRADSAFWARALAAPDAARRRLAARAVVRLEGRAPLALLLPALADRDPSVRAAAAPALARLARTTALPWPRVTREIALLERDPDAAGAVGEAIGRAGGEGVVPALGPLLAFPVHPSTAGRAGAARGAYHLARGASVVRTALPAPGLLRDALHRALAADRARDVRVPALLALARLGDRDTSAWHGALADTSAEVRRAAVAAARAWVDDAEPRVRIEALRAAGDCARLARAVHDTTPQVALVATDLLAARRCDAALADSLARDARTWQQGAHALAALARLDPARARTRLAPYATHAAWQARAWAAQVARAIADTATLRTLARDTAPNVAAAAIGTSADALRALGAAHHGLALAGAEWFASAPVDTVRAHAAALLDALDAQTRRGGTMRRDVRTALLARFVAASDGSPPSDATTTPAAARAARATIDAAPWAARLAPYTRDADPAVARLAHAALAPADSAAALARAVPPAAPLPDDRTLAALRGARLRVTLRALGTLELALLADDAPATVAAVVALARAGRYDGTTFHRVEPNFVLQGGSPGANEYDAASDTFWRDETGGLHRRGTWGISTRGRDTGDGQFFVNLVDNHRLDGDYTVFARTVRGEALLDRVVEGTVIERVEVVPARRR